MERILEWNFEKVIIAHGQNMTSDNKEAV